MPSNQIKSRTCKCIAINYASKVQLLKIPGMKSWLVEVILLVRKNRGCITKEMLQVLANGQLPSQSYATMDFTLKEGLYNNKTIHGQSSTSQNKTFSQKYSVNGENYERKEGSNYANQNVSVYISDCSSADSPGYARPEEEISNVSDTSDSTGKQGFAQQQKSRQSPRRRKRARKIIHDFPEWLAFDGKDNWYAFKQKFLSYAELQELTPQVKIDCLCLSLKDKAAEYFVLVSEALSYDQLLSKLERRFGDTELPAAALVRFQKATQSESEDLENWSDRVHMLARPAFKGLPQTYINNQIVMRFCQGLTDKEAAYQVSLKEPKDIDEAIHSVRWCQHVRQVVFGKTSANDGSVQKSEQQSGEKQVQGYQEGCTENQDFSHESKRGEVLSSEEHIYWGTTEGESDKSPEGPDSEIKTACQIQSASQFTIPIQVGDRPITAVIDSAAECTIISDRVYQSLHNKPAKLRDVKLMTAGRQLAIDGFVVGPVKLKIGTQWYSENVCIAPIEKEMLLGFDILFRRKSVLNMAKRILNFDGEDIRLNLGKPGQGPAMAGMSSLLSAQVYKQRKKGSEAKLTTYEGCFVCGNLSHLARDCVRRATVGQTAVQLSDH